MLDRVWDCRAGAVFRADAPTDFEEGGVDVDLM